MRKQILAFFVAMALLLGSLPEGIAATGLPMDQTAVSETEELVFERPAGGLEYPEGQEVPHGSISEPYEGETDASRKGSAVYKHDWDKYSTNYYYNQLPKEAQELWDTLDEMCLGYLTSTESVPAKQDSQGIAYPTKTVMYVGMSNMMAKNVLLMFKFSNPQYYFLDSGYYYSMLGTGGSLALTVFPAFANGTARRMATGQMQAVIDSWMTQIMAQPDDLNKEKLAHDLICEKVIYDPNYDNPGQNPYNQVAYSVFCTDSTVCAGYSQAMQMLMNAAGIDCAVVTSRDHEWNIIRLNHTWYNTDLTWNDLPEDIAAQFGQGMCYDYFNRSSQQFLTGEGSESHIPELMWNGYLPDLVYDSGATHKEIGTLYMPTASLAAPQIVLSGSQAVLAAPSGGAIYYTTDGSNPSVASTRAEKYTAPVALSGTTRIRAIAVANGYVDSAISEQVLTPEYQVIFHANGGYINKKSTKSVAKAALYGAKVGKLVNPKRKGYAFLGWYTKKSGGSRINQDTVITASQTYYAHWAKIKPKKATIASAKNSSSKAIKVKIKNSKIASGYQLRYSTQKNMSGSRRQETSETTCTIKKLKKGSQYYVQVRMFQKESVSGKKSYGPWSKTKAVKVKK